MDTADLILAILVPLVTGIAGWMGVEMSLRPPQEKWQTIRYRGFFVSLILAAVVLNVWQTARASGQQNSQKIEFARRDKETSDQIGFMRGQLASIAEFERHFVAQQSSQPSSGVLREYLSAALAVMNIAQAGASSQPLKPLPQAASPAQPGRYDNLSDQELGRVARSLAQEITDMAQNWKAAIQEVEARYNHETYEKGPPSKNDKWEQWEDWRKRRLKEIQEENTATSKDVFTRANEARKALVIRLRSTSDAETEKMFDDLAASGVTDPSDSRSKQAASHLVQLSGAFQ
jgi:hypothetical protein